MKDYTWLAVFSIFTLVTGVLFTFGNGTNANEVSQPTQIFVMSTTTPPSPVVIERTSQPITVTLPEFNLPAITVNVSIATSSLPAPQNVASVSQPQNIGSSYTYYVTTNNYPATTTPANTGAEEPVADDTATLSIQGIYQGTTTPITSGQTILELLTYLNSIDTSLGLETQDYGELGVLVTAMGGLENGTVGKYWQYTVNGEVPMIGADKYELQNEDEILWEFKGF